MEDHEEGLGGLISTVHSSPCDAGSEVGLQGGWVGLIEKERQIQAVSPMAATHPALNEHWGMVRVDAKACLQLFLGSQAERDLPRAWGLGKK